jgi:hypothetical protein
MTVPWIFAGIALWTVVAVPLAVAIGRSLRIAEDARVAHPSRSEGRLVYRCARCRQRVDYASEQLVDVADRVHELDCCQPVRHG